MEYPTLASVIMAHSSTAMSSHGLLATMESSPYHSRGNGKAESAVKIAKNILKKSREEDPYIALLA